MASLALARDYLTAFLDFLFQHPSLLLFTTTSTLGIGIFWYLGRRDTTSQTITIINPPTMRPKPKPAVDTTSTEEGAWRRKMEESISSLRQLVRKSISPLSRIAYRPKNDPDRETSFEGLVSDLRSMGFKDVETLLTLFVAEVKGVQDDKHLLLEHMVQLLSKLNPEERLSRQITAGFINNLYNALPHPALTTLDAKHQYRRADGSYNNILMPDIGKAGNPYTKSAKSTVFQNVALPDPGVIFDTLMERRDIFEPHPNGISSMLFYFATVIIHDIFRTDHGDFNTSTTSSYLDLSPLYGSNDAEQATIRTFNDGQIKPDCFTEKRLLGFPPGVGVVVIMFNRFHNYVATTLATINENGRFTKPNGVAEKAAWQKFDDDLFQTARLITCGLYVNIILKDYVRTILSLNRTSSKWDLDPRTAEAKTLFNTPAAEGVGNQVSAEFNIIYRWHSALSEKDDKWTQKQYSKMFRGRKPEEVSLHELLAGLRAMDKQLSSDPLQRAFAELKRDTSTMKFDDDDLVEILEGSITDVAGSFGANKIPKVMRSIEILGIIQSRAWNVATLNEFRQFAGLKKHESFEDINPDPEVAQNLKNLYDHPDLVELYPGLVSEKPKPAMSPGSGLCVNFTTSYAILSDAVCLVRGDRFYTIDYTPKRLTNWGFNEVNFDRTVNDGCVFYKLIFRSFPNHFKGNSIFAHYPFVVPEENLAILKSLGRADRYSWDLPARKPELIVIKSYAACKKLLEDKANWKVTWGEAITFLVSNSKEEHGADYCLAGDGATHSQSRTLVSRGVYPQDWEEVVGRFYGETTTQLLNLYSHKSSRNGQSFRQVDIVRDVSNLVNTRFAASVFNLPIKTAEHPRGVYTEQELYQALSVIFISIFFDGDIAKNFQLKEGAYLLTQQLGQMVLVNAKAISATGYVAGVFQKLHRPTPLTGYGVHMIQRLLDANLSIKEVVWSHLMPTASSMTANQSQIFSQALDYYLGEGKVHVPDVYKLTKLNTKDADEKIMRYFMEGARLTATVGLFRDFKPVDGANTTSVTDGDIEVVVPAGRRVLADLIVTSRDPLVFPDPNEVKLDRPLDSYIHYGIGPHQCVGNHASIVAMTAMFKVVFGLKGLRRAQGSGPGGSWYGESQGELKKIPGPHGLTLYMTADQSSFYPFPTTMKVEWDEDKPVRENEG